MKLSKLYFHTLREVPAEAEIASHILLLRAGMIRKLVSGVYGFLPLGSRVLRKVEEIIRQEMDAKGAQEILMSAVQPAELWQESGRWYAYGPELWRLKDRHDREFCLGPTHEEVFTDTVRQDISSHRQLPFNLYQIQTKYRDEARPRFGLIRSREFIMKDAYSFDRDEEGLAKSYDDMYEAYEKVFSRCGLEFRAVEADSGAIGGSRSHEFCALSSVGESNIAYCNNCGMAATAERAGFQDAPAYSDEKEKPLQEVATPDARTIEEVADFLGIPTNRTIKALLLSVEREEGAVPEYVAVFIRGDRQLNKTKLVNVLDVPEFAVNFADEAAMGEVTGSVAGFTGPMGLRNCKKIVDTELVRSRNLCAGACKEGYHILNVNYGRDYEADITADLKLLQEGDPCPVCGSKSSAARGIEVGQVFMLGTKYSSAMGAFYTDEEMNEHPIVMGCYGIGVTRTIAAVVEQNHDGNGIIWPMSLAPYHVCIVVINPADEVQMNLGMSIHDELEKRGVEVLIDDRDERPGVKFKDVDLIGIPIRITVGKKAGDGVVELKRRRDSASTDMTAADVIDTVACEVKSELDRLAGFL